MSDATVDLDLAERARRQLVDDGHVDDVFGVPLCRACNRVYVPKNLHRCSGDVPSVSIGADPDDDAPPHQVCVYPTVIDTIVDDIVELHTVEHDFSTDIYEAWDDAIDEARP